MATSFKKRALSPETLQEVAAVTAGMPVNGEHALLGEQSALLSASTSLQGKQKFVPGQTFSGNADSPGDGAASCFQVGNVYDVPVGAIRSNPLNPRYVYTATAIDLMTTSLSGYTVYRDR